MLQSIIRLETSLTLIDSENGFDWVKHKGDANHDSPDTHARTSHPKHKEGHKDLLGWRLCKLPGFLNEMSIHR